ncbi:MAG: isoleucine--tRNA ligase, partial [Coriobacteriales bacterium]
GLENYRGRTEVAIWTTTPWTLPADQAVILHPEANYVAVLHGGHAVIFAEALAEKCCDKFGWDYDLVRDEDGNPWHATGVELEGNVYKQPIFADQGETGRFIYADYVTLEDGTGIVHSAPGHGVDDYNAGMKFDIPMVMPVDDDGRFYRGEGIGTGGPWGGMSVDEANPKIIEWLDDKGLLILHEDISHSYPHCWRCKQPVIFRATTQWFVSMDRTSLRQRALDQIETNVQWIPEWASHRIGSMVEERPDWCISRQRYWGVPIPVFTCKECGSIVADEASFDAIIELFRTKGADAWYTTDPKDFLPVEVCCPNCGSHELEGSHDVLDVWWESGVSHTSVCEARPYLHRPADLYLEGSDQHRGWFQSSLLTSVGAYGEAPYKAVMSCGFTVDDQGRKMSKSIGNTIDPIEVCNSLGADVLRLWVGSVDYSQDMSVSEGNFKRCSESYRRIRNTFRYLLSNLYDFTPADYVSADEMLEFDKWAMARLQKVCTEATEAYDAYHFHTAFRAWYDFVVSISSVYFDAIKDRLYSDGKKSVERRSAQTVLANMLDAMVRQLAPILTFTCDEVYEKYPEGLKGSGHEASIQLADWTRDEDFKPQIPAAERDELLERFATVMDARDAVTKAIEDARNDGLLTKSQEAAATLSCSKEAAELLEGVGLDTLADIFIVASVAIEVSDAEEMSAEVEVAQGEKCPRCWNIRELGDDGLCARCHEVVAALPATDE